LAGQDTPLRADAKDPVAQLRSSAQCGKWKPIAICHQQQQQQQVF